MLTLGNEYELQGKNIDTTIKSGILLMRVEGMRNKRFQAIFECRETRTHEVRDSKNRHFNETKQH